MAVTSQVEWPYSSQQRAAVIVITTCGALSLIAVLGMFLVLGISALRGRRSSNEKLFVQTQIAMYFICLLICNFAQAIGAILNLPWIVQNHIYIGVTCTAQAAIKHIGSVGSAIFVFVIAAHTFSLLFYSRRWSNRTSYIVLAASWGLLLLDMCINFMVADPAGKGPYYGISGYWCWITSGYPTERWATHYLFMWVSALFSLILYLLVFFRLRAHKMPGSQRVESYLDMVGKKMLWHPIIYIVLVIPHSADRFYGFSGKTSPLPLTTFSSSGWMLSGFINVVVFSITRNVLPWNWKKTPAIRPTLGGGQGCNQTGHSGARMGGIGGGRDVNMETHIETKYDDPDPDTLESFLPSVMTSVDPTRPVSEDIERSFGMIHWTGYNQMFPQPPPAYVPSSRVVCTAGFKAGKQAGGPGSY